MLELLSIDILSNQNMQSIINNIVPLNVQEILSNVQIYSLHENGQDFFDVPYPINGGNPKIWTWLWGLAAPYRSKQPETVRGQKDL